MTDGTSEGSTTEATTAPTTETTTATTTDTEGAECDPVPTPPPTYEPAYACFVAPDRLGACEECVDECLLEKLNEAITGDPFFCSATGLIVLCGPDPKGKEGECCYHAAHLGVVCEGRPLRVDGEVRAAPVITRGDWSRAELEGLEVGGIEATTRAALAAAWAEDAAMEHASIAGFARLILELMREGAPAGLIAEAQAALGDEVEHARACFAIAGALAGAPRGPGGLSLAGLSLGESAALSEGSGGAGAREGLARLAVETLIEGCVGETLAAALAKVAGAQARAPRVRELLRGIGADEARHAALAWKIVGWAIELGGAAVRAAVEQALAAAMARPPQVRDVPEGAEAASWQAWGRLSAAAEAATIRETMRSVIAPCAAALLGEAGRRRSPAPAGQRDMCSPAAV